MNSIEFSQEGEYDGEGSRLSDSSGYNPLSHRESKYNKIIIFSLIIIIVILCVGFVFFKLIGLKNEDKDNKEIINTPDNKVGNLNTTFQQKNIINNTNMQNAANPNIVNQNQNGNKVYNNPNKKIGLAFVYSTMHSNGIAKSIALLANYLIKTGRYDICFISSKPNPKDYAYNKAIKRFDAYNNFSKILDITLKENIDIFILHNAISMVSLNFYHRLGKKVITLFHGLFFSSIILGNVIIYRSWPNFDLFDSYVFISSDDYYFYKKLGFQNEIFIPNLYSLEGDIKKTSNLAYNNILMLGKLEDPLKGAKYAIEAMPIIIKQVPDAKLNLVVTSEKKVKYIKDLIKKMKLTKNVFIVPYKKDMASVYLNSSVLMYTSLSEGFPLSMIEGKAYGLPIIAFDVPYSPPYQDGIITVEQFNTKALADETVKLLKDYKYRKRMGEYAKKSLEKYTNQEIILIWEKLFKSLINSDINYYRNLQKEIEAKYYKEEEAKNRAIKSYKQIKKINNNLDCHTLDNLCDANYLKQISECKVFKMKSKNQKSKKK